jgi:fumarate hydratase class I
MTSIHQEDLIASIADALQFISYYHPLDYIRALGAAYEREESPAARDAMAQILYNSRLCAEGHRPICQDTGMVVAFLEVGMAVRWEAALGLQEMVDEGVRRAYLHPDNRLRASMVAPPYGERRNTRDNTPAVVHVSLVPGDKVHVKLAAKGGGSENKSKFAILNPSDSLVDWVLRTVPLMGAGWCPPGMLGIGIGGSAEKAMLLAKEALMEEIDIHELKAHGARNPLEELRLELYEKVNALGIGAQGLGGLTTVLDVKIKDYPTHAASLPVAMIPNCAATRHVEFTLDGSGPAELTPPRLEDWPDVIWQADAKAIRVNLDAMTKETIAHWQPGDRLLLSGKLLTGRDAAHKRLTESAQPGRSAYRRAWISPTALFITSAPSIPSGTRWSAPPAPPPPPAWINSPSRCWPKPASSAWWARPSAVPSLSRPSRNTAPSISWRSAARPIWSQRPSRDRAWWPLRTWGWRPSASSTSSICRSPSPWIAVVARCIRPAPPSGRHGSAR